MPRLRLATLRRQSRDSARRFSRLSCACATAVAARLRLSDNSHALVLTASRSVKLASLAFKTAFAVLRARSPSALSPPPAAQAGAARGSLALPPCVRAAALRVCSHGGASRLRADFSLSLRSPRGQAPLYRGFFTRWRSSLRVLRPCRLTQSNKTGILYN